MSNLLKNKRRVLIIGNGAIFQLLNAFGAAIIAYFIINFHSPALWGKFATLWLYISWFTLLINFGNKDYLLKEYSLKTFHILGLTKSVLLIRIPILILSIIITYLIFHANESIVIIPILIFSYIINSYQPLLIFEKKFSLLLLIESVAIIGQLAYILYQGNSLNLIDILISFLIYNAVKLPLFLIKYHFTLKFLYSEIAFKELKNLLPFFLLTIGGMLINKADFMMVAAYLDDHQKAYYQLISTFSNIGIIVAHAVLQPFTKQIYRVNKLSFEKIAKKYFQLGILLSILFVAIVYLVLHLLFNFQLSMASILLLYIIELVFFATNPWIYYLFRNDKQDVFLRILIVSGLSSLAAAFFGVQIWGIEGALCSNLTGNFIMLIWIRHIKSKEIRSVKTTT
jgi:O-antigen/teichoic acid export membrane protein